jgi:hypothetical protein
MADPAKTRKNLGEMKMLNSIEEVMCGSSESTHLEAGALQRSARTAGTPIQRPGCTAPAPAKPKGMCLEVRASFTISIGAMN